MSEGKAMTKADDQPKGIRGLLLEPKAVAVIQPLLPEGLTYERIVSYAFFASRQNPEITLCTPASIIDAISRILQWGLDIGLTAHLVPFNRKVSKRGETDRWEKVCTPVADYKGIAELMVRSGAVRHVEAHVVYSGDKFDYRYGTDAYLHHTPTHAAKERGEVSHAYVLLRLPGNMSSFEVMGIEDIEAIRTQYSKQWGPDKVKQCPTWYAKKTVVRQSAKLIPKDRRLAQVLSVIHQDEAAEFDKAPEVLSPGSARTLPAPNPDDEIADTVARHRETVELPLITDPDDPRYYDRLDNE